jgi:hypothetical protein
MTQTRRWWHQAVLIAVCDCGDYLRWQQQVGGGLRVCVKTIACAHRHVAGSPSRHLGSTIRTCRARARVGVGRQHTASVVARHARLLAHVRRTQRRRVVCVCVCVAVGVVLTCMCVSPQRYCAWRLRALATSWCRWRATACCDCGARPTRARSPPSTRTRAGAYWRRALRARDTHSCARRPWALAVRGDGAQLITGADDGTLIVWRGACAMSSALTGA